MLGLTNQEIARRLMLSHETIKTHLGNILVKLNARDRTHAAVIGIAAGLIALEDVLPSGIEALRAF
jgi:DNA-binding NarL/FixJ family response regulator